WVSAIGKFIPKSGAECRVQDVAVEGTSSTDSYGGPWSPYFFAPRRRFCAIFSPTCTCLDFAQQSIRFLLIQPPGI
ncbi:hypothetical protein ACHMWL_20305, partial [Aeromonas caviae]|uniref:hypothetical protein n=1 Tax=Aeromonas caviae TaxID=648 RepID=UPI003754F63F